MTDAPPHPWATDRPLDDDIVRAVLRAQFPDLDTTHVRFLAAGWDNETYLVDETWALRFPKRANVVPWLQKEIALLPYVADALDVDVPHYELHGVPDTHFPYLFVGYRLLPGVQASETPLTHDKETALARRLGEVLGALHALDPDALDVPWQAPDCDAPEDWRRSVMERADKLQEVLSEDLWSLWAPYARGEIEAPAAYTGPGRVIHHDLGLDHVLLDPETHRLTGLIDFMDAHVYDPMFDFMDLYRSCGPEMVARTLETYPHELDDGFLERLRFMTRTGALLWLYDGIRRDDEADWRYSLKLLEENLTPELRAER